jgi:hypothetical protein
MFLVAKSLTNANKVHHVPQKMEMGPGTYHSTTISYIDHHTLYPVRTIASSNVPDKSR